MILRGGAILLTKTVTKFNRLAKCPGLMEAVILFTEAPKNDRLT
jgi:hypothetical protein